MPPLTVPYARAARMHLARVDPVMAAIIAKVGACRIVQRRERFRALARAIIFQQLAGAAATAIYGRVVELYPGRAFPHPTQVLATPDAILRKAGLSAKKALYIKDLATHVEKKILNFHRFARMTDEEVIADLTRVKGIGRWTAEMFLMFNLARPDVLPVDDLGVRNAVGRAYSMRQPPTPKELRVFGQRWSPYRTAAAWYLWKSLEIKTPGTPDKKPAPRQHR
ncbi:MAG: DNA-3-methyladenine glycosylase [Candidatus Binataceae bacterium]